MSTTPKHSVLLIGPSTVTFTEEGEEGRPARLLLEELQRLRPEITWSTTAASIYQGPGMLPRVRAAAEDCNPDVVFVRLSTPPGARIRDLESEEEVAVAVQGRPVPR
jgi:hypothetical protein